MTARVPSGRPLRWRMTWPPRASPLVVAVLGALGVGAVLMIATGHDPLQAYGAMARGALGGPRGAHLAATLNRAAPIVGMGLAAAIAFRAGLLNIGGEGQLVLGGLAAALAGLYLPLPGWSVVILSIVAAAVAGGIWAGLAGWLEFRCGMPLLITTLLMIYPARALASYLVSHPLRDVASGMTQSARLSAGAALPRLGDSRLHAGLLIVLGLVGLVGWAIGRTRFGYHVRMTGLNVECARYGGVDVEKLGYRILLLSGAVAGVVGAIQVLAIHRRFIDGALTQPLYAWMGIMVALLARSRPAGILLAGLLFAALQTGGFGMERATEVPRELSQILQALVILFIVGRARFRLGARTASGERS